MKQLLGLVCALGLAAVGLAADSFVSGLTPEERRAAGLDNLTPAQQQALDALAERYATAGAQVTETRVREETKAEVAKVREETKVEVAKAREEAKVQADTAVKKHTEATVGLEDKLASKVISSRIQGTFKGWNGRTLFTLENGQQWVQTDPSDSFWLPPQPGPEVELRHSGIGGWKMFLMPDGRWVRVRRVN
jgi:hypothetical protein